MNHQLPAGPPQQTFQPEDNDGVVVEIYRMPDYLSPAAPASIVLVFKIPLSAMILTRNPRDFMTWCFEEFMKIAKQMTVMGKLWL